MIQFHAALRATTKIFNVLEYGAVGDGVTDDTASQQAAITAACNAAGGGMVVWPTGIYKTTSTLVGNATGLKLMGWGNPVLLNTVTSGDMIHIRPDVDPPNNGGTYQGIQNLIIDNLSFESTVKKTSGWVIRTNYTEQAQISNIRIDKRIVQPMVPGAIKFYDGVLMENQAACKCGQNWNISASHCGLKITGQQPVPSNGGTPFSYDGCLEGNFQFWGDFTAGSIGLHIAGGNGGFRTNGTGNFVCFDTNIRVDKSHNNATNYDLFFSNFFNDSAKSYGMYFAANSANAVMMNGCWVSAIGEVPGVTASGYPGQCCVYAEAQTTAGISNRFVVNGGMFRVGGGGGIQSYGGNKWTITGSQFSDLGLGPLGGDGIFMSAGDQFVITGNGFYNIGNTSRGTGVKVHNGVTKLALVGNQFDNCGLATYAGPAHNGTGIIIQNNSGI